MFLTSWSSQGATVDFSCALTGANADFQAQQRGDVVSKPIYVTNDNPKPRTANYATDAQLILTLTVANQAGLDETYPAEDFDAVLGALESALGSPTPLWLYVNGGQITEMVVQDADSIQIGSPRPT